MRDNFGHFINTGRFVNGKREIEGYDLDQVVCKKWWNLWRRNLYLVTISIKNPLAYCSPSGIKYSPDDSYISDLGSIPPPLWGMPGLSKDDYLLPYLLHDYSCDAGGLWTLCDKDEDWKFTKMTRLECDKLLQVMIRAEGGGTIKSNLIYSGVRIGAAFQKHPCGFPQITIPRP